ncbi:MAG: peptidoglycan-binding domain-containing protein, partial [Pseudomonadota bacterium]
MTISPLDLGQVDKKDGVLIQRGLQHLGFYDGTFGGVPGPKTKGAYNRYRGGTAQANVDVGDLLDYSSKVEEEFEFPGEIAHGARGNKARRVQEWLSFHDFRTPVDGNFSDASERSLKAFQNARGVSGTGIVDKATWDQLVAPMVRAFSKPAGPIGTFPDAVLRIAGQHLREHPIEINGQNKGPWVRAYMNGNEGDDWPWCAGFVM